MRNLNAEGLLHLGLVQHGKMRSADLGRELVGMAGQDVANVATQVPDGAGEIKPGANPLVREMIDAALVHLALRNDLDNQFSQIPSISRRAHLVKDDLQRRALRRELPHRLHEVLPVW